MPKSKGYAVAEFALVFPVFFALTFLAFETMFLLARQYALERTAARVVHDLALSSFTTPVELQAQAQFQLRLRSSVRPLVQVRSLTVRTPASPLRPRKIVEVIELELEERSRLFPLKARVREPRVRDEI